MHRQNHGERKRSRKDSPISAFLEQIKKRVSFRREWGNSRSRLGRRRWSALGSRHGAIYSGAWSYSRRKKRGGVELGARSRLVLRGE
jgi:hypothetical protein